MVYFIENLATGVIKIGLTKHLLGASRLVDIVRDYGPCRQLFRFPFLGRGFEQWLHNKFASYNVVYNGTGGTEWFRPEGTLKAIGFVGINGALFGGAIVMVGGSLIGWRAAVIARKIESRWVKVVVGGGILSGALFGLSVGTILPGLGILAGIVIGTSATAISSLYFSRERNKGALRKRLRDIAVQGIAIGCIVPIAPFIIGKAFISGFLEKLRC